MISLAIQLFTRIFGSFSRFPISPSAFFAETSCYIIQSKIGSLIEFLSKNLIITVSKPKCVFGVLSNHTCGKAEPSETPAKCVENEDVFPQSHKLGHSLLMNVRVFALQLKLVSNSGEKYGNIPRKAAHPGIWGKNSRLRKILTHRSKKENGGSHAKVYSFPRNHKSEQVTGYEA